MAKKSKYAAERAKLLKEHKNITWLLVGLVLAVGVLVMVSYQRYQARQVISDVLLEDDINPVLFWDK